MSKLLQANRPALLTAATVFAAAYTALGYQADKVIEAEEVAFVQPALYGEQNPTPPIVAAAAKFDDGKIVKGSHEELPRYCSTCNVYGCTRGYTRGCGFFQRGPVRRVVSAPFRWLFRRRR